MAPRRLTKKKKRKKKMRRFSVGHLSAVNQCDWQVHVLPVEKVMEEGGGNRLTYRGKSTRRERSERERDRERASEGGSEREH